MPTNEQRGGSLAPQSFGQEANSVCQDDLALITISEAMRYLKVSKTTLYAILRRGEILSVRHGRRRRIPWRSLREYVERGLVPVNREPEGEP